MPSPGCPPGSAPAARISHAAFLPGQRSAALTAPGALTGRVASEPLLVTGGAVWLLRGWQGHVGGVGRSGSLRHPFPAGCQDITPLFGAVLSPRCSCPGVAVGTGRRGTGRLTATTRHRRHKSPKTHWLVAEIPFISLNCVTSNTACGRISVDLSYWGWRVQNLAEKNLSCTEKLLL